jgi:hypothetical protein
MAEEVFRGDVNFARRRHQVRTEFVIQDRRANGVRMGRLNLVELCDCFKLLHQVMYVSGHPEYFATDGGEANVMADVSVQGQEFGVLYT